MNTCTKTLALLIDGDNAHLQYTKQILQFCEGYGTLTIKNVYGDWKKPPLSAKVQELTALGVERVQQDRVGDNATDFGLAMDVALMLEQGDVDIYFIVSSDGDFTAVCGRIRQKGAKVIGIGSRKNTSGKLQKFCGKDFYYVEDIAGQEKKVPAKAAPAPKAKPSIVLDVLIQAYQKIPQRDGWVFLPEVGNVLRQHHPQLDEQFGKKKLSTRFRDFPEKFEVTKDRVRMR